MIMIIAGIHIWILHGQGKECMVLTQNVMFLDIANDYIYVHIIVQVHAASHKYIAFQLNIKYNTISIYMLNVISETYQGGSPCLYYIHVS